MAKQFVSAKEGKQLTTEQIAAFDNAEVICLSTSKCKGGIKYIVSIDRTSLDGQDKKREIDVNVEAAVYDKLKIGTLILVNKDGNAITGIAGKEYVPEKSSRAGHVGSTRLPTNC